MQALNTDEVRSLARAINTGGQKFPPDEVIALVHTFGLAADSDLFGWQEGHVWRVVGVRDAQWRRCGVQVRRVPVEYTRAERVEELEACLKVEIGDGLGFSR